MTPTEQGRFCASCQKTVVDYTSLTDQQLIRVLSQPLTSSCGRFRTEQLNRSLPPIQSGATSFWPRWVSLLTMSLLSWQTARAQTNKSNHSARTALVHPATTRPSFTVKEISPRITGPTMCKITGNVVQRDSSGNLLAVPKAYLHISGAGSSWPAQADSSGAFTVLVPIQKQATEFTVKARTPSHQSSGQTTIEVSPLDRSIAVNNLTVYGSARMRTITAGGIVLIQPPSRWQKLTRKLFRPATE